MITDNFKLDTPAVYAIRVAGTLDDSWSDRFGGLAITICDENDRRETLLCGRLSDQAALVGVINSLYDYQFALISVE